MKGEDKIFLLQAYHAVNGSPEIRKKFREDVNKISKLVAIVDSYGVDGFFEEIAKIRRASESND